MARYTFVTESHWGGDEKKTVEILSRSEVEDIAAEAAKAANSSLVRRISSLDRKLTKAAEQAAAAAKDAKTAEEEVKRLVETARETFREVIEETLHPIFQYGLEQSIREVVAVKEENKTLKEEIAALRAEIDELKSKR